MKQSLERRECLRKLVGFAILATGAETFLAGCGSNTSPNPPQPGTTPSSNPPPIPSPTPSSTPSPSPSPSGGNAATACTTNGTVTNVQGDPLHTFFVSKADVIAGTPKSYHIQGRENHDHILTLTAGDFAALQRGESIAMNSGLSIGPIVSHFHTCTVACAAF